MIELWSNKTEHLMHRGGATDQPDQHRKDQPLLDRLVRKINRTDWEQARIWLPSITALCSLFTTNYLMPVSLDAATSYCHILPYSLR